MAPEQRLQDLRKARIVNLPTPRRRISHWASAGVNAVLAVLAVLAAVYDRPVDGLFAALFLLGAAGQVVEARRIVARLRHPATAAPDEPPEWEEAGEDVLEGAVSTVVSGGTGGLIDIALGFAVRRADKLRERRKPRQVARWQPAVSADLRPAERVLVSSRATLVPHGLRRLLIPLTFGFAALLLTRRGFVTVTDQRLLFHRRRRLRPRERYLHLSLALAPLEVLEWYEGAYLETRRHVLIVRGPGRRVVRLNVDRVWADEAQGVFEAVASRSERPPAFLAARWRLGGGERRGEPPALPSLALAA